MDKKVRVRFAPSPTGYLHIGGARSVLFNYLYAKNQKGTFVLRIEDTDTVRSTRQFEEMQKQDMRFLGLDWDEGPDKEGPYGPYRQSERQAIYQEHAKKLLDRGQAYYCFCTDAELEEKKALAMKLGRTPQYDGKCRHIKPEVAQARLAKGEKGAVRFWIKNPKKYQLNDLVRGTVEFQENMVGDFIILRAGGMPVYNFCVVIDDHLMNITHVLRAEEHLSNTVRQLMLFEVFGWEIPQFGHMSVVLGTNKQKLSKREGATSVNDFKLNGYLPSAINNYNALLGWSSPDHREVLSMDEMIRLFSLDRVNSSPAVFDDVKLKWMNSVHLRALDHQELWRELQPFFKEAKLEFTNITPEWIDRAVGTLKTSFETLKEAVPLFEPLSDGAVLADDQVNKEVFGWPTTLPVLQTWAELLKETKEEYVNEGKFQELQKAIQTKCNVKGKEFFQALRVAILGKPHGAELKLVVPLISRKSLLGRVDMIMAQSKEDFS